MDFFFFFWQLRGIWKGCNLLQWITKLSKGEHCFYTYMNCLLELYPPTEMREYFRSVEQGNWKAASRKADNSLGSNHPISQQQESDPHRTDNKMHPMRTHGVENSLRDTQDKHSASPVEKASSGISCLFGFSFLKLLFLYFLVLFSIHISFTWARIGI